MRLNYGPSSEPLHISVKSDRSVVFIYSPRATGVHENNYLTEMCRGSEAGSYSRPIAFCITQIQASEE